MSWCSSSSVINDFQIDEESWTGSFLDRKYTSQTAILTEKKLCKIWSQIRTLPHKSSIWLAQQAQVFTTVWRVTKKLHLLLYRIRQVQVKKEIMREKCIFVTGQYSQYMMISSTQTYIFYSWSFNAFECPENSMYSSSINPRQAFWVPFTVRRLVCCVLLLLHE
jgi:hypothetical protein